MNEEQMRIVKQDIGIAHVEEQRCAFTVCKTRVASRPLLRISLVFTSKCKEVEGKDNARKSQCSPGEDVGECTILALWWRVAHCANQTAAWDIVNIAAVFIRVATVSSAAGVPNRAALTDGCRTVAFPELTARLAL